MKRDLKRLTKGEFDVLVIGGGIAGACVAWDATLRGLRVALVERSDFGGETSANSLKTIHGGLRYLQDGDVGLVRKMIKERQAFLRIAPHLVHPLPFVLPTYENQLLRSKFVLGAAVKINDLIGFDRNVGGDPQKALPAGRVLSRSDMASMFPRLPDRDLSGGIMWYDAQMYNSERLLLSFLLSATRIGAQVANYVQVVDLLQNGRKVVGVKAEDRLSDRTLEIPARVVVNAAGPWVDEVLSSLDGHVPQPKFLPSVAINLVTSQIVADYALGMPNRYMEELPDGTRRQRSRILFAVPWRGYSIIGTLHKPADGSPGKSCVTERVVSDFIREINDAYPGGDLKRSDVYRVHHGLLPTIGGSSGTDVRLVRKDRIVDHQAECGIEGLITVVSVKYTTGRSIAEEAVNLVNKKLGRESPPCRTHVTPLYGGQIRRFNEFLHLQLEKRPKGPSIEAIRQLVCNYGTEYRQLLAYMADDPCWAQPVAESALVTRAQVLHSVRSEMAVTLTDVVIRRTELGSAAPPSAVVLDTCSQIIAAELGWNTARINKEIDAVWDSYGSS